MHDVGTYVKKTNNLTEEKIEFDVNSKFDESSFHENFDERMIVFDERNSCFA